MKGVALPFAVLGLLSRFASADHDLVFPIVALGDAGENDNEFKDFHAQVMDVQDGLTTYSVGCATDPCAGWSNLGDFTYTMAIGPNTFDFKYSEEPILSTRTACTFTGEPATAASCEMTNAATFRISTLGYEHHFTVPGWTGSDNWDLWNVQSATLKVIDGTVSASPTASGESTKPSGTGSASATESESGKSMVTSAPSVSPAPSGQAGPSSTPTTGGSAKMGASFGLLALLLVL